MSQVASKLNIPVQRQRYWNYRRSKDEKEAKPISYEYMLAVGAVLDGQSLFVEEIPEPDVVCTLIVNSLLSRILTRIP